MSKRLLQDIVKIKRPSRDIKEFKKEFEPKFESKIVERREKVKNTNIDNKVKGNYRYYLWFVAFISVIFCFFAFSFLFSKAEVVVNPKIEDVVLNENLSASIDSSLDTLSFNLVEIEGVEEKIIQTTETKEVQEVARGTVILYNAFSSSPQTLSVDTRLEGSNGKIYKTKIKTVLPGMNKNTVPGSVEVEIYAAGPGGEYNSVPLDFKILGFKGTSKYSKFYGRSKGSLFGGFIGKVPAVLETDKIKAISDLKNTLKTKLSEKAGSQIPSGFVLFKDATFLNVDESNITSTYNKDNSITLSIKGTFDGILFNEDKLTKIITSKNIKDYDGSEIFISNIKDLIFLLSNKENINFSDLKNINFNLSGNMKVVYRLDVDNFILNLLGKKKNEFNQLLIQYKNIDSATLVLSPVWKRSIPDKTKNIKVIVNYPK